MPGIANHRPHLIGELLILLQNLLKIDLFLDLKRPCNQLLVFRQRAIQLAEFAVHQVCHANTAARNLILIARPDSARRCANRNAVRTPFADLFDSPVEGKNHMRAIADFQLLLDVNPGRFQPVNLIQHRPRINHHAVANDRLHAGPQNTARDQLQNELLRTNKYRVAGIMPALVTRHRVELLREQIDNLALALIAPLCAQHNQITHSRNRLKSKTLNCTARVNLFTMQMCGVFTALGPEVFHELVRGISIGKLKTYQVYERFKLRARLVKLNSEALRKAEPKLWARIESGEEDFATDLSQVFLLSHLPMIVDVLNLLGIPNDQGFFDKDLKPEQYLTEGWQKRVFDEFSGKYSREILLFYINHLDWELNKTEQIFLPAA